MDKYEQREQSERHEMARDDFYELLQKYAARIQESAGSTFIHKTMPGFTEWEIAILMQIDQAIEGSD